MLDVMIRGAEKTARALLKDKKAVEKAHTTAIKVEGFRLVTLFKKEIRAGAPGGRKFTAASIISQTRKRSKKILNRLALGIRYVVDKDPFRFRFGWVGPKASKSWKRLAEMHQEGFERVISPEQRRYFRIVGASLKGRWSGGGKSGGQVMSSHGNAKFFFINRRTTMFKTPARPMRDPFWMAHRGEVFGNVRRNFRAKLAGQRI